MTNLKYLIAKYLNLHNISPTGFRNIISILHLLYLNPPSGLQLYQKETPAQMFSCEICEIFKKAHFEEYLGRAAAVNNSMYQD